jgi:acrylyl-CoA reductase (NADPH)
VAVTGRPAEHAYLASLGAAEIVDRATLAGDAKLLDRERWAGGIDTVGSKVLANLLAMTISGGAVAACGNAGGMDLPTSVAPFILRGVSLLGVNSVTMPRPIREEAWARLARDLDHEKLNTMTRTIGFEEIPAAAADIAAGRVRGRILVNISP